MHICINTTHYNPYYKSDLLEKVKTLIRFDNAQAAVLTVEPLFGNIILARGGKAP